MGAESGLQVLAADLLEDYVSIGARTPSANSQISGRRQDNHTGSTERGVRSYPDQGDPMYRPIIGWLWLATVTAAPATAQQPFSLEHFRKFVGVGGVQ